MKKVCGGCEHYEAFYADKPEAGGHCYRNPPTVSQWVNGNGDQVWSNDRPAVGVEERACGDYEKKEQQA
jgi:hypothetical protein